MILAFFSFSDGIVNENIVRNFILESDLPEFKMFYHLQLVTEDIHNITYSLLIDKLI